MRSGTIPLTLFCENHMLRLFDTRYRLHVDVDEFARGVYDARGTENVPVGVEGSGAGEAGRIGEGEGGFEAGAGDYGEETAGVVEVDTFVACELYRAVC